MVDDSPHNPTAHQQAPTKASPPPPEPAIIPLGQHRTPKNYRAKNREFWPALVATHLRDDSGRAVNIAEYVEYEIGIIAEAAGQVIQELRANFEEKLANLEGLVVSQPEAIEALRRAFAAVQSDADQRDYALRVEVDAELASLRAALEERIDVVAAYVEPNQKHGNRRSPHRPAEIVPPA
jgi:hypothetical protein